MLENKRTDNCGNPFPGQFFNQIFRVYSPGSKTESYYDTSFCVFLAIFFSRFISPESALFLAISGTLTDIIDGVFARKRNQVTDFGKIFDPIADKIMAAGILWYLFTHNLIDLNLIIHIILPETLLIVYGIWLLKNKWAKTPEPNILGRTKFILYALGFIFLLISQLNNLDSALSNFGFLLITLGVVFAWSSQVVIIREAIESIHFRASFAPNKNQWKTEIK